MTEKMVPISADTNMATIRAWVEAINRNDIEAELACWQPDGEYFIVPTGSTYRGLDEIRQAGKKSAAAVGGQPIQGRKRITHLDAGEEWACVEYDAHATITGPIIVQNRSLVPPGVERTVIGKACVVFQMKGGKIARAQEYFDTFSMMEQLGLDREALQKMYDSLSSTDTLSGEASEPCTPVETVRLFVEAWNEKDLDGLVALLGETISGRNPLSGEEAVFSREVFRNALVKSMKTFPNLHMRIDRLVAEGDLVSMEEFETATLMGTEQAYAMPVASFIRVNAEGKIVQIHNYWDTKTYFDQLGMDPETLSKMLYSLQQG